MSDRYMLATKFQGKIVDVVRLTNWGRRSIALYAFCTAAVADGSKTIEELYRRLEVDWDYDEERIEFLLDHAEGLTVVDLDERNIYFDSSGPYDRSRPVIQTDTLIDALLQRPDEEDVSFLERCQIGDYWDFRCPFDMFDSELLLRYVRKHYRWIIEGWVPEPAPELDSDTNTEPEEQRERIGMPEIPEDCTLGKYQFSIYELFLMGIAFEKDAETIAFVNLLNQTLKKDIDECVESWEEEAIELYSIFKYNRDMIAQERQELQKKSLDSIDAITLNQKNILKRNVCSERKKIPGIIRNGKMDALAERNDELFWFRRNVQKELCIWTIGELEAADLSKSKNLSQEDISEIEHALMWYHARPYWEAHPEFDEAMKEWRKKQPIVLEEYRVDELDLSVRAYNCLKRAGINTLADLADMSWDELIQIRNLGRNSAKEIREKVKEFGIHFGLDD